MGARVVRIEQDAALGKAAAIYTRGSGHEVRVEGDALVCAVPLGVLSTIEVAPGLSGPKRRAIRQVTYQSSTKVLARTARRFWEADEGIYGGGTYTDLPIGISYYPADNAEARDPAISAGPGVLLASYTWAAGTAAGRVVRRGAVSSRHPEPGENSSPVAAAGDGAADRELQLGYESL